MKKTNFRSNSVISIDGYSILDCESTVNFASSIVINRESNFNGASIDYNFDSIYVHTILAFDSIFNFGESNVNFASIFDFDSFLVSILDVSPIVNFDCSHNVATIKHCNSIFGC